MEHLKVESDGIHMLALWKDEQIGYTDEPGEPAMLMHGLIDLEEDEDAFQGEEADELRAAWPSILASLREQGYEPYEDD